MNNFKFFISKGLYFGHQRVKMCYQGFHKHFGKQNTKKKAGKQDEDKKLLEKLNILVHILIRRETEIIPTGICNASPYSKVTVLSDFLNGIFA